MKIYIVRHGETWFNQIGRIQGWCDSPLTKKGIQQAQDLQNYFKDKAITTGYYSGSERAGDTLELILGDREVPIKKDRRLKEVFFGDLEARYVKDLFPDGNVDFTRFYEFGGEDRHDAAVRFYEACKDIAQQESGDVLLVSHGSVIRQFLEEHSPEFYQKAKEMNVTRALVPNCSVSILEVQNENLKVIQLPTTYEYKIS